MHVLMAINPASSQIGIEVSNGVCHCSSSGVCSAAVATVTDFRAREQINELVRGSNRSE